VVKRVPRLALGIVVLALVGAQAWRFWRGPDPAEILAAIEVPSAPSLSPEAERATFRLPPGFRAELVAAEPLVIDPVAMDWDDEGRLYVVEMRGYMPNLDGDGEDEPVGRVVVLEDEDGDGRMDRSDVFLDGLVLPRAVAALPNGVLIGAPPDLWLCRDTNGDRSCDERTRLGTYGTPDANPEHSENGLFPALDGWLYNAKSDRRFRLHGEQLEVERTLFRGQWGIAQDDAGRLFHNHNSAFLLGDSIAGEYIVRQPWLRANPTKLGVNQLLTNGAQVFGVRVAPGLNRAYMAGTLRADGRQDAPTGVSGVSIQRGDQYGPEWRGTAFIPEAAGSSVAAFSIERDGLAFRATHKLFDDPEWEQREFLASTDERFRPVDAAVGPDGAIWIIDMYRGVIQHAHYASEHLRAYVGNQGLESPGATGRIWRIVREDRPLPRRPASLARLTDQLAALDDPNGWARDHAQRRLVYEQAPGAVEALRDLDRFGPIGRRHALWALAQLDGLELATWRDALRDPDPQVREIAIRAGESLLSEAVPGARAALEPLLVDTDEAVRIQAIHALGSIPASERPVTQLLDLGSLEGGLPRQAALSSLAGLESTALARAWERAGPDAVESEQRAWLLELGTAAFLAAREGDATGERLIDFLDAVAALTPTWQREIALEAIERGQRTGGSRRIELSGAHPLFSAPDGSATEPSRALTRARRHFTWPGDPTPGGARPLTPQEQALREQGRALFAASCAQCHGAAGAGMPSVAPSLVGSPWVRDADDWLVRIVLDGLTGPVEIRGETWDQTMPGHRRDPRFDDTAIAGLLTHLRRSWGHAEDPVTPATVARIRAASQARQEPWTVAALLSLPIEHRFDHYTGVYAVPIVNIELAVERNGTQLSLGLPGGPSAPVEEIGDGLFVSPEMAIQFETNDGGEVEAAQATRDGTSFPLSKRR
jgi:mono/diheme cytochrome c family protein/glucose/arabinose dehydrogenase